MHHQKECLITLQAVAFYENNKTIHDLHRGCLFYHYLGRDSWLYIQVQIVNSRLNYNKANLMLTVVLMHSRTIPLPEVLDNQCTPMPKSRNFELEFLSSLFSISSIKTKLINLPRSK